MRTIGWILNALGFVFGAASIIAVIFDLISENSQFGWLGLFRPLGSFWADVHLQSLQLLQPAIERHVSETLYFDYVQPMLLAPAAPLLAGVATGLFVLGGLLRLGGRPVEI